MRLTTAEGLVSLSGVGKDPVDPSSDGANMHPLSTVVLVQELGAL